MSDLIFKSAKQFNEDYPQLRDNYKLLVEGSDDVDAFDIFTEKSNVSGWIVISAGSKSNVLKGMKKLSNCIGVVDRDDWSDIEVSQSVSENPNLFVLPRFCIESYCIVPSEISSIFEGKLTLCELESEVNLRLEKWLRHGALWHVFNPMWRGLRAQGFNKGLLAHNAILTDEQIRQKIIQWRSYFDVEQLIEQYQDHFNESQSLALNEQLISRVHGKFVFDQVITDIFNKNVASKNSKVLQIDILKRLDIPADLQPLWDKMQQISHSE